MNDPTEAQASMAEGEMRSIDYLVLLYTVLRRPAWWSQLDKTLTSIKKLPRRPTAIPLCPCPG